MSTTLTTAAAPHPFERNTYALATAAAHGVSPKGLAILFTLRHAHSSFDAVRFHSVVRLRSEAEAELGALERAGLVDSWPWKGRGRGFSLTQPGRAMADQAAAEYVAAQPKQPEPESCGCCRFGGCCDEVVERYGRG